MRTGGRKPPSVMNVLKLESAVQVVCFLRILICPPWSISWRFHWEISKHTGRVSGWKDSLNILSDWNKQTKKWTCYIQDQINNRAVSFRPFLWWQIGNTRGFLCPKEAFIKIRFQNLQVSRKQTEQCFRSALLRRVGLFRTAQWQSQD